MDERYTEFAPSTANSPKMKYNNTRSRGPTARTYVFFPVNEALSVLIAVCGGLLNAVAQRHYAGLAANCQYSGADCGARGANGVRRQRGLISG